MRVHQPGGHLMRGGRPQVEDWSWAQTRRRLTALYHLAQPYKLRTALAIVSLLAATAVLLIPPLIIGATVNEVKKGNTSNLVWLVLAFVAVGVLGILTTYAQTYFTGWTGERMLADLRDKIFRHLQRLSLGFYERNRAGVIISRLTNDVEALDQLVTDGVTSLIQNTLTLVGTAVILFFLDWRLALATLAVMPAVAFATAWFRKRSGRAYRSVRETLGAVTATLAEDIAGMRVLQSFTREQAARENFREVSDAYRVSNMATVRLSGLYFPFVDFLASAATAVVLGFGGYLAYHGDVSIGVVVAFLGYLANFFDPVQQLSQLYNTFLSAVAALDKITDLLEEEPEVEDATKAIALGRITGRVGFEDVQFSYGRGPRSCTGSTWTCRRERRSRWSATRARGSRRSRSSSHASTTRRAAGSPSTAATSGGSPRARCAGNSGSCRRKAFSSRARWPTTSRSAGRARLRARSPPLPRRWGRTSSSQRSRTATRPNSGSAAPGSRSASAS